MLETQAREAGRLLKARGVKANAFLFVPLGAEKLCRFFAYTRRRGLAVVIVYGALGVVVVGGLAWLTPAIATQVADLSRNFPTIVTEAQHQIVDPANSLLLARLPSAARTAIAENAGKAGAVVGAMAGKFGSNALGILTGTSAEVIDIFRERGAHRR